MNDEQGFFVRLTALAGMVRGFVLTEELIQTYERLLGPLGFDRVNRALDDIMVERDSHDPFPSIKEIRKRILPETDPETEAVEAANRVIEAVSKDGWTNPERARARIGELGWGMVQAFGGWRQVCETLNDKNVTTIRAQLRDLARVRQTRALAGMTDQAPRLPEARKTDGELKGFAETIKLLSDRTKK